MTALTVFVSGSMRLTVRVGPPVTQTASKPTATSIGDATDSVAMRRARGGGPLSPRASGTHAKVIVRAARAPSFLLRDALLLRAPLKWVLGFALIAPPSLRLMGPSAHWAQESVSPCRWARAAP